MERNEIGTRKQPSPIALNAKCGKILLALSMLASSCLSLGCIAGESTVDAAPKRRQRGQAESRRFEFHYKFAAQDLPVGKKIRVWLPVPTTSDYQEVTQLRAILPGESSFHTDAKYGNRILFFETEVGPSGAINVDVPYEVVRKEVVSSKVESSELDEVQRQLFLGENDKVPVDGKPTELLSGKDLSDDNFKLANQLYEIVDNHVAYNKEGTGWGNGDVLWVCDSGKGNCTDFHSLFISLARSKGLPARFEIGFPLPPDAEEGSIGGYHCWAFFHLKERGWLPVDISEADKHPEMKEYYFGNLTADRLTFSTGRDIELTPKAASGPLNYFVYPHLEVGGKKVPKEKIDLQFSFSNR